MITRNAHTSVIIIVLAMLSILLSSCAPRPTFASPLPSTATVTPTSTRTAIPTATVNPLPSITLKPGEGYFSLNGEPAFLFSRNPAGWNPLDWETIARMAHQQGDHFVRLATNSASMGGHNGYGYTSEGEILEDWSDNWEHFFELAEAEGLYVMPNVGGWIDWNTTGYNTWKDNPFNSANGGPADDPHEIFKKDSPTQQLYVQWFKKVVTRWSAHRNILAWEVISEVNLINGISQPEGIYLAEQLANAAREADALHRPVTASVADWSGWSDFLRSDAVEFISLHPYSPDGKQDRYLLWEVREYMNTYHKPILIGESGLRAATPDSKDGRITLAPNARIGIRHAIWAQLVSGAMNGRALWWEDGFGVYFPGLGMPWVEKYADVEAPVVRFVEGMDMTGFKPVPARASDRIFGAALGNETMIIGWYRDASCEPPDWNLGPVVSRQTVTLTVSGTAPDWQVDFYDAQTGTDIIGSTAVSRMGDTLTVILPDFTDDIAFKMHIRE